MRNGGFLLVWGVRVSLKTSGKQKRSEAGDAPLNRPPGSPLDLAGGLVGFLLCVSLCTL